MNAIGVGIIGAGGIAQVHLQTLSNMPEVRVLAIADVVPGRAKEVAERWGIPHAFEDYQELLKLDAIQAVHVCTYNQAHRAPSVDALHAGKHVMVEKPMAATLEDAIEMVRAAKQTGKMLMCAIKSRYSADVIAAKRIIREGTLGEIYYAETVLDRRRGIPGGTFVRQATAGLGAVADIGVYCLDTALYLMGHPTPQTVSGITTNVIGKTHQPPAAGWKWDPEELEVEEFGAAWIRFTNGAVLVFKTSWAMHMDTLGGTFFLGTKAGLRLTPEVKVFRDEWGYLVDVVPHGAKETEWRELFRLEIEDFYRALREGRPSPIDPEEVLLTNVIIDGVIRSAREGGREVPVAVPDLSV